MTRVHVYGASGYAGAEMIALLAAHPAFELGVLESASHAGEALGSHFPRLRRIERYFAAPGSIEGCIQAGDAVVLAGANGAAKTIAPRLLERGAAVIDLSGDFRLPPSSAVYGLPERYHGQIAGARFVANPGCYPTATLLATLPLAALEPQQIIVDAKSGITGAGRTPAVSSLFAEVSGEIRAYGLQGHRHEPEILAQWREAGMRARLLFTPCVVPIARGMLVNAYALLDCAASHDEVRRLFLQAYDRSPFVRVLEDDQTPSIAAVTGSNDAEIHVSAHGSTVRVICAIDNLGRGAATQAIVNLNLMHGYSQECGLDARAFA